MWEWKMQEFWFCSSCKSMNRASAQQCYRCRALKVESTLTTVTERHQGVVLTPGLDEEHREVAWTLMFRQTYISAWRLGYVAAALLLVLLGAVAVFGAMTLAVVIVAPSVDQLSPGDGRLVALRYAFIVAALIGIVTVVVHSTFLYLASENAPALGSGSPRFDPIRAAVWWIESLLWAIRGGLAFVMPPFLALAAILFVGPALGILGLIMGLGVGIVWFVCAFWLLGDPITCLGKPQRLLKDLWDRLAVPGSADARIVSLWSAAWGTGRGVEFAIAGMIYVLTIVLILVVFLASRFGFEMTLAPEGQIQLVEKLVSLAVVAIEFIADAAAVYLLAQITIELAKRQRVREAWVLGGLDAARTKAQEDSRVRDEAALAEAARATAVSQPEPAPPHPVAPQPPADAARPPAAAPTQMAEDAPPQAGTATRPVIQPSSASLARYRPPARDVEGKPPAGPPPDIDLGSGI
jgi:hypothetical protein